MYNVLLEGLLDIQLDIFHVVQKKSLCNRPQDSVQSSLDTQSFLGKLCMSMLGSFLICCMYPLLFILTHV